MGILSGALKLEISRVEIILDQSRYLETNFPVRMLQSCVLTIVCCLLVVGVSSERLVAADSLTECKGQGNSRICDGAVTKELKSTTPSVQNASGTVPCTVVGTLS